MRLFYGLIIVLILLCLPGCKSRQGSIATAVPEPTVLQRVEDVRTEYREILRIDTVEVRIEIPAQSAMELSRDTASILETDYARSWAWIDGEGLLGHRLENKAGEMIIPTQRAGKDTEYVEKSTEYVEVPVAVPYAVEVEKQLSAWQRFRLGAFWWMAAAIGLWVAIKIIKIKQKA